MLNARNTYERYLEEIASYPRISLEREAELSQTILNTDDEVVREAAIDELIHANLRLVVHCLKDFDKFLSSPSVRLTRMDLIAEGNIGLMRAASRYDAMYDGGERGTAMGHARFSTYACKCIQSQMRRAVKNSRFIHIPEHHFSYWSEVKALREAHGEELSDDEMAKSLDVSSEVAGLLKKSVQTGTCMLEDLVPQDRDSGSWHDFIPNDTASCPANETGNRDLRAFLVSELESLPPRTQSMLSQLYLNEHAPSLRDLGKTFGISSERCRQVCMQGLNHLRRRLASQLHKIEPDFPLPASACAA
jgi:RNA polymerase sigma factor (sigma-70 family)